MQEVVSLNMSALGDGGIYRAARSWHIKRVLVASMVVALAASHLFVVSVLPHPFLPSNIIQLAAALLAVTICGTRAKRASTRYFRRLWIELCLAFSIWGTAQVDYIWHAVTHTHHQGFSGLTDFLWLLFSFPILLVASRGQDRREEPWTNYLDMSQVCLSITLLYAALYVNPGGVSEGMAYGIQNLSLLLACIIRYSTATTNPERRFFRNLTIYVSFSGALSVIGSLTRSHGPSTGSMTDLAWSVPILIFCGLAAWPPKKASPSSESHTPQVILPPHIHGISSLALALTSMGAGVLLTLHRPYWGVPALFVSCTLFALRTAIRESQLKRAHLQLEHAAGHDDLTGLANRALLFRKLRQADESRYPERVLLFLDLDRFKLINDTLGHGFGDSLLIHVAQILRSTVRPGDIVARLGGDEFAVLLCGRHEVLTTEAIASRILDTLRSPIRLEGREIYVTASMGIVAFEHGTPVSTILLDADAAMYRAKSLGKNRSYTFDGLIRDETMRASEMEAALRSSLEESAIVVSYQPIYSLRGESLEGFEALARWKHPRLGPLSANQFIQLAEDTGLITELGRQVFRTACHEMSAWNRRFHSNLLVSVNVSARELLDKGYLAYIKGVLDEVQLPPSLLRLEVTEAALLSDKETIDEVLKAARAMGVSIWLADFGKGFSSLGSLMECPFEAIKIDKRLVEELASDHPRYTMVRTIIQLAKGLCKKVIAEGVESEAQLQLLTELNCDSVQGFFLSRPMASEVVSDFLEFQEERHLFSESAIERAPHRGHVLGQSAYSLHRDWAERRFSTDEQPHPKLDMSV